MSGESLDRAQDRGWLGIGSGRRVVEGLWKGWGYQTDEDGDAEDVYGAWDFRSNGRSGRGKGIIGPAKKIGKETWLAGSRYMGS